MSFYSSKAAKCCQDYVLLHYHLCFILKAIKNNAGQCELTVIRTEKSDKPFNSFSLIQLLGKLNKLSSYSKLNNSLQNSKLLLLAIT